MRRRRAERFCACGALARPARGRSTRTLGHMRVVPALLCVLPLLGCSPSYSDLEDAFAAKNMVTTPALEQRSMVITSQKHRGAESYRDLVTIRLSVDSVDIENSTPFAKAIKVPTEEIAGCSMTCFGVDDQHINLLIPRTGSDLMIPRSEALLDWCWSTRRPMISGGARRNWQYHGVALPKAETFADPLNSRELYDAQVTQSCLGF